MPVSEVNQIIRDPILMGQTRNFISQWGLGSVRADPEYSGIFFKSELVNNKENRSIVFGTADKRYLTASDWAHEIGHGLSKTMSKLDLDIDGNRNTTANEYARRFVYEEGKAEYNRFQFDLRNNPKETKYGSDTAAIKAMNQQQAYV
ncbi:MAG: hypothetical protein HXM82_08375 [Neisseria sp.]|nr:hypothetical protein [Neisseria sp.]